MNMKKRSFKPVCRLLCAALTLLLCLSAAVGCSRQRGTEVKDPILECREGAISLSFYEFMLSRM
jgi:hypothetical protein